MPPMLHATCYMLLGEPAHFFFFISKIARLLAHCCARKKKGKGKGKGKGKVKVKKTKIREPCYSIRIMDHFIYY